MNRTAIAALVAFLALTVSALAHGGPPSPRSDAFQVRFGWFFLEGDGEFWETNEEVFSLSTSDFDRFVFGLSYVHSFDNKLELGANIDFYDRTVGSYYRDWVDERGLRIYHDTYLGMVPLTVDVRFLPTGRHRIRPGDRRVLKPFFYIGGGIGFVLWSYEEYGDFLDFSEDPENPYIFPARFKDDGTAFEYHGLMGVELPMGPASSFLFEGRYSKADDKLGRDFEGLGDIELGGASIYAGFAFRF
jgi:hypothetical protein